MPNFYLTFGQRYNQEEHPTFINAHPDGYVRIEAPDKESARKRAFEIFSTHWAFLYAEEGIWDPSRYPRGEILHLSTEDENEIR